MTVHLADYWQDLPLSLSGAPWSGGEDFIDVYGPWDIGDTLPFPALSIPVRESDDLTVALARNADGSYEINGYDFTGISSAMYFTPFSLPLEGGTLTTLGIDPAAQPQPDWAPEGYGLWYIPVQTDDDGSSTPVPSRRQLVYPLDITRQQVVTLKQEELGGTVYLMTQEDGQLVLRLLEGGTYRLLQELSLGPAAEDSASYDLAVRDGFAVVFRGEQLTVLSRTEEGYHLDYTCPTQTAYVTGYTVSFTDPELEKQDDEDAMPYTVAPNFAMAYQDGKLAVAAYVGNSSMVCVLLLEVYGPEGLLYATARVPSVERQFAADNVRSMWVREDKKAPFPEADISTPIPELTWEK